MKPQEVLDFWFGPPDSSEYGRTRPVWFRKDEAFDAGLRTRFGALHADAMAGRLDAWEQENLSCLALIVVLDQFSRNLFRGRPESFAGDAAALRLAHTMVARGGDAMLLPVMRWFVYLPYEHSESVAEQDEAMRLFAHLASENGMGDALEWARKHRDVILRFGRFPHRNAILGRRSTPAEMSFLETPGSSF